MPKKTERRAPRALGLAEMLTLTDETDDRGRLLLEDSAPGPAQHKAQKAGVPMETVKCPYEDTPSRYEGNMNQSAYGALRDDISGVLNGFAWLSERYIAINPSVSRSSVRCLIETSNLAITLPQVAFRQAGSPVRLHGSLPSYVASIFKAARGIFSVGVALMNLESDAARKITAGEVVEIAEDQGHLVRAETGRVCAAPTKLISRALDAILTGGGADSTKSTLPEFIDFPTLWEFYQVQEAFSDGLNRVGYALNQVTQGRDISSPQELFEATFTIGAESMPFGELAGSFVQQANAAQDKLNNLLGRAGKATPLAFKDILSLL
ncbi:MAG: hypothetical protein ACR2FO_00925 [Actinomycetota bacterium]